MSEHVVVAPYNFTERDQVAERSTRSTSQGGLGSYERQTIGKADAPSHIQGRRLPNAPGTDTLGGVDSGMESDSLIRFLPWTPATSYICLVRPRCFRVEFTPQVVPLPGNYSIFTESPTPSSRRICRSSAATAAAESALRVTEKSIPIFRSEPARSLGRILVPRRFQTSGGTFPTRRNVLEAGWIAVG